MYLYTSCVYIYIHFIYIYIHFTYIYICIHFIYIYIYISYIYIHFTYIYTFHIYIYILSSHIYIYIHISHIYIYTHIISYHIYIPYYISVLWFPTFPEVHRLSGTIERCWSERWRCSPKKIWKTPGCHGCRPVKNSTTKELRGLKAILQSLFSRLLLTIILHKCLRHIVKYFYVPSYMISYCIYPLNVRHDYESSPADFNPHDTTGEGNQGGALQNRCQSPEGEHGGCHGFLGFMNSVACLLPMKFTRWSLLFASI